MNTFSKTVHITKKMVKQFGDAVHDHNPIHFDAKYAATTRFKTPIAHGALLGGLISGMLVESYGEGTIYIATNLQFLRPVYVGSYVRIQLTTRDRHTVDVIVLDDQDKVAIRGTAKIVPGNTQEQPKE